MFWFCFDHLSLRSLCDPTKRRLCVIKNQSQRKKRLISTPTAPQLWFNRIMVQGREVFFSAGQYVNKSCIANLSDFLTCGTCGKSVYYPDKFYGIFVSLFFCFHFLSFLHLTFTHSKFCKHFQKMVLFLIFFLFWNPHFHLNCVILYRDFCCHFHFPSFS